MTGRVLAVVAALTLLLTGCGSAPAPSKGGPVTVTAANGKVAVPGTDTGIWALDVYTALNLLAVGVTPTHAARTHLGQEAREGIVADAGVELVGAHRPELVVGAQPSLIVGMDHPEHRSLLTELEAIAPVVLLADGIAIEEQLEVIGTMTGHAEAAARLGERAEAAVTDVAERVEDSGHAARTVSVVQQYPTVYYAYDNGARFASLLDRVGLERPASQSGESEWGYVEVSEENLADHTADIVIALTDEVNSASESVLDNPILDTTDAITAEVEFSGWYDNDLLSTWWLLSDVEAIVVESSPPTTFDDVDDLWAAVLGAD